LMSPLPAPFDACDKQGSGGTIGQDELISVSVPAATFHGSIVKMLGADGAVKNIEDWAGRSGRSPM